MSRLKQLIHEVHRRSLWQVFAIYAAVAWVVLQIVEVLTGAYGLPPWFPGLAAALLLMGLPFVLATAFVQEGAPGARRADPTLIPEASDPGIELAQPTEQETVGVQHVFNWRNAVLIGTALFAVWGVIATIWLLTGFSGLVVRAEAADIFSEQDKVVVAWFGNETDQPALGLAVREAVVTDLAGSDYVEVADRSELKAVLDRMMLPDSAIVTDDVALEIARREGYPIVISGEVIRLGSGYQITARIIEASTGEIAVRVRETAASDEDVISTVEQLSRLVRRHLGEALTDLQRSEPLPQVATRSLEALELYAQGAEYGRAGHPELAIPLLEQAVELDTAFATAYRALGIYNGNIGRSDDAQRYADRAYTHKDRLARRERYLVGALYHAWRLQFDSTIYYYELEIERDPNSYVAINNLGDLYERMGRYEEAFPLYRLSVELQPDRSVPYINLQSVARTLGEREAADSALSVLVARFPNTFATLFAQISGPAYDGDFDLARTHAQNMAHDSRDFISAWGHWYLSSLGSMNGYNGSTLAFADTAIAVGISSGATLVSYLALQDLNFAMLAAGESERALPLLERTRAAAFAETSPFLSGMALGALASGYALAGDLAEAQGILEQMDSVTRVSGVRSIGAAELARGIIALQENRVADAIEHLQQSRRQWYGMLRRSTGLLLADAYAANGDLPRAAALYDSLTTSYRLNFTDQGLYGPTRPLAHERAAAVYITLGDTAKAINHLTDFTELWKDADAELQPRVESALRLLDQLAGER
jgi:tetratricopeptide (TPR) repeat protein